MKHLAFWLSAFLIAMVGLWWAKCKHRRLDKLEKDRDRRHRRNNLKLAFTSERGKKFGYFGKPQKYRRWS